MKMRQIREKAVSMGLKDLPATKIELVRAVQRAEGNTPCFATAAGDCPHKDCCFRSDCLNG